MNTKEKIEKLKFILPTPDNGSQNYDIEKALTYLYTIVRDQEASISLLQQQIEGLKLKNHE